MDFLAQVVVWLNAVANALGGWLLAPIAALPGWLSATIVSAATGVLFLLAFKYTSNQGAIKRVRNDIKANLFALKLFKDNVAVTFRAQGGLIVGALRLTFLAIVPMVVMMVPVTLILGQMALWYQVRPLQIGEEAVVTLKLNGEPGSSWPEVRLAPTSAARVEVGPVRVLSQREVCWKIAAGEVGYHHLEFEVNGQPVEKELAIGDGFMRVSMQKPEWSWSEALLHPAESPFGRDSLVKSIEVEYPQRSSWTSGTDKWVIYWFVVSMIAAFCFRRVFNVNI
jgi:hypothetical protein